MKNYPHIFSCANHIIFSPGWESIPRFQLHYQNHQPLDHQESQQQFKTDYIHEYNIQGWLEEIAF